ncbi:AsmA family protein [soil metagenome]
MADQDAPVTTSSQPKIAIRGTGRTVTMPLAAGIAVITSIIGLLLLAWAILFITKGRFLKHPFERIVGKMTNRQVRVAGDFQLYFNPIHTKFLAEGLTVSNPSWATRPNLFEAKKVDSEIATLTLLFGAKRRINWLGLDSGHVDLEWNKDHSLNTWTFSEKKGEPFELPLIRRAAIAGTELRYRDPKGRITADLTVGTVEAKDTQFASAIRFAGGGNARGYPFTVSGALLSPNATMTGGRNQLQLHVTAAKTNADIWGTLPGATEIEGADLHIDVRGRNIADLFNVIGVAIPETRTYRIRSALTKAGDEWRFTGLAGRFGDSDIGGTLTVKMIEPRILLTADLKTRKLDIVDAAPFIGYNPDDVAARGASAAVTRVGGSPRILPDATLRIEALKNFDAKVQYHVTTVRARSLPVSNIDLKLGLDDSLLKLSPLTFDMARGHVASDIIINARRPLVFTDYDIRLSPTPMGVLLKGFGVEESGTTGTVKARIKLTGSGNTVHDSLSTANGRIAIILPQGSFWTRNVQIAELDIGLYLQKLLQNKLKEPVQINCGLIGFTVRNGIAAADPILIDTKKNVMLGRGGFSFKNESLDLAFRADGKNFSLFSGQSPVGIGGYFAAPTINPISPQLITRAGVALGLGIVATPLAAILAFVDVGDAKSAACGPILAGATASAQRTSKGKPRTDVGHGTTAKTGK